MAPKKRKTEANNVAKILRVKHREKLGLTDDAIEINENSKRLVIEALRKYHPAIILCNAKHDNHPGQSNAAKLVTNSNFISGLKKYTT